MHVPTLLTEGPSAAHHANCELHQISNRLHRCQGGVLLQCMSISGKRAFFTVMCKMSMLERADL